MTKRIVIDIESMSTFPNAAMLAVAVVIARDDQPEQKNWIANAWFIAPELALGHVDSPTMEWWQEQNETVKKAVFGGNLSPREALQYLNSFLQPHLVDDDYFIYADPAAFDFPILKTQFQQCGILQGWSWRREKCMSGMKHALEEGMGFEVKRFEPGIDLKHHPIHDALFQMHELRGMLSLMKTVDGDYHGGR